MKSDSKLHDLKIRAVLEVFLKTQHNCTAVATSCFAETTTQRLHAGREHAIKISIKANNRKHKDGAFRKKLENFHRRVQ